MSDVDAIYAARSLISRAESLPDKNMTPKAHIHPKEVFGYKGDNWRKWTLERIDTLFECNIPEDGKTPLEVTAIKRIEGKSWASPEEFLAYHEERGFDHRTAAAISDLIRRWKAERARIGPTSRRSRKKRQ